MDLENPAPVMVLFAAVCIVYSFHRVKVAGIRIQGSGFKAVLYFSLHLR